eukprot:10317301-Lingulodinium_polyedra.AAC.1
MPRVSLVPIPRRRPPDHPVQEPRLLEVRRPTAEATLHLAQEVRFHLVLHPVQVLVVAGEGEVVPMHDAPHLSLRV